MVLERVPCIHYPLRFRKDTAGVRALVDSGSEVNAMTPAYAAKLGLQVRKTEIGSQKIDGSIGKLYLGPIHLVDPGSTRSTQIYLGVLLIHLQVPRLTLGLL